jgi:hypothetical protein
MKLQKFIETLDEPISEKHYLKNSVAISETYYIHIYDCNNFCTIENKMVNIVKIIETDNIDGIQESITLLDIDGNEYSDFEGLDIL